jgi:transcriptional repressor AefR-like protein
MSEIDPDLRDAIDRGELTAASARRTAQHFVALTFLLALPLIDQQQEISNEAVDDILVDGVAVFLQAYRRPVIIRHSGKVDESTENGCTRHMDRAESESRLPPGRRGAPRGLRPDTSALRALRCGAR